MKQSRPRFVRPGLVDRFINRMFGTLVGWGLGFSHNYLLQVQGRTSGRMYSTPVNVLEYGTRRFLVAPRGETQWVRNARVSGQVRLVKGKTSYNFRLRELADVEKPEILKTYLDRYRTTVQRYFPVPAGSPLEAFSNLAPMYPVFELRSVATKTVSGPLP